MVERLTSNPPEDSLMRELQSSPRSQRSPRSPIFAPFRHRHRMLTEETVLMHNIRTAAAADYTASNMVLTDSNHNPFLQDETTAAVKEQEDDRSDVSSLSHDSRRRWGQDENEPPKGQPPQEITILVPNTTAPEWLQDDEDSSSSPPPPPPLELLLVWTGGPSPGIPRPTMGRNRSSPMVFASTSSSTLTRSSLQPSLRRGGTIGNNSSMSKNLESSTLSGSTIVGEASILSLEEMSFLGNPQRRCHRRKPSAALSIGSMVGVSSFVSVPTATPTATSSFSDCNNSWRHELQAHEILETVHADPTYSNSSIRHGSRKRNPVKEELKYVWGRVATPMRRLTGTKKTVDLQRASGCLT